jgi:hypothetical protein
MNQLQAIAMNEGKHWKKRLWREQGRAELEKFQLAPWASQRWQDLTELLDRLTPHHRRINHSGRAGSEETARSAAVDDTSWCGVSHSAGFRADHRDSVAVPTR